MKNPDNNELFHSIYVNYFGRMKRFAREYVMSDADAENIVQDVFADLWHKREILSYNVNLVALLFTAVKNRCIDFLRHVQIKQRVHSTMQEEFELTLDLKLSSLETFDDHALSTKEIEHIISEVISKLPPRCREIFIKSRIEGKKQAEIASELGISVKTVENQMTIAYRRLRIELKDYLPLLLFLII